MRGRFEVVGGYAELGEIAVKLYYDLFILDNIILVENTINISCRQLI
jgi:hypothetical protein